MRIYIFLVLVHKLKEIRNLDFTLKDILLYIPHTTFTNILAIDTVFVNSYIMIFHKAQKYLPFFLNLFSSQ